MKRSFTDAIRRVLFLHESTELPKNFKLNDEQWSKLTKEVPKVIKKAQELNEDLEDSMALREKVQKSLALRFYEITKAAQNAIEKRKLQQIGIEDLKQAKQGAFLVVTETGSIHYFEVYARHIDFLECQNYDRQSYYNLKIDTQSSSDQTKTLGSPDESFGKLQKIRVKVTHVGQLDVFKGIKNLSGYTEYKRSFTTTKIKEIYTSPETGQTSMSYVEISSAIEQMTNYFMLDLSHLKEKTVKKEPPFKVREKK
ncbi:MAG: hypothetical protein HUU50_02955 [Candidatus Brocadiae bacterium]|nr:hypothetical protein [Candidatus Brocadiia bacterium]